MGLSLFPHNKEAYYKAHLFLQSKGKAAIIHPTGTGKSFIGFELCFQHPKARICWLSPSEYIFQTQLENLKAAGGTIPENITFYTFAKLMLMDDAELSAIAPDFIVLDEFHRLGAECWGGGVNRLLALSPKAKVLGLSATAIRYLDNQRDMAAELFEGNIASEITLGEAIVRGILNPPKYILSVFSYQKDLERYEKKIHHTKSPIARDAAKEYLEALRRRLENAQGLDALFAKHMTNRTGKYIVFCANRTHMQEMISMVPEWFSKIDTTPHIYSAYAEDPATDQAFADFKTDTSRHLKLLFCIDMLNEGVHVEDISGVILLRPTVSPIIYKQQIGRALSASKKTNAVVFDIVMNIENLYSIGAIEEEMRVAMTYYRATGEGSMVVNDHFRVIDEVRECRELFARLNDTLTASWEYMYAEAKIYFEQHGHLNVPKRYTTMEGYSLGEWLNTQRKVYFGKATGILTPDHIARLNKIGMRWESASDFRWQTLISEVAQYVKANGNLDMSADYQTQSGYPLGKHLMHIRSYRKSGIRNAYLTEERIAELDRFGMIWDAHDYVWENNFNAAKKYYRQNGNLSVPAGYIDESGVRLGQWLVNLRTAYRNPNCKRILTDEQIQKLNSIGMRWGKKADLIWEQNYSEAKAYYQVHGHLQVPVAYQTETGFRLGKWLVRQRNLHDSIPAERKQKLDQIGMVWQGTYKKRNCN